MSHMHKCITVNKQIRPGRKNMHIQLCCTPILCLCLVSALKSTMGQVGSLSFSACGNGHCCLMSDFVLHSHSFSSRKDTHIHASHSNCGGGGTKNSLHGRSILHTLENRVCVCPLNCIHNAHTCAHTYTYHAGNNDRWLLSAWYVLPW